MTRSKIIRSKITEVGLKATEEARNNFTRSKKPTQNQEKENDYRDT